MEPFRVLSHLQFILDILDSCSHERAAYFYVESVENTKEKTFPAVKCSRKLPWKSCDAFNDVYMGYHTTPPIPEGDYYLKTNDFAPFNRGMDGIIY